jgi:uncharacterized MAPEG superfamily protein
MMSPDLKYLLFSTVLTFVQVLLAATFANFAVGLPTLAGNRDGFGELPGIAGRAKRAHLNMIENMILFIPLVLITVAANKADATTAMGAMIFFWARVAYAIIYVAGIPWLRTVAWLVSVVGMIMIALRLF